MIRVSMGEGGTIEIYVEDEETVWVRKGASDHFRERIVDRTMNVSRFVASIVP
jgi:hypothetical protein